MCSCQHQEAIHCIALREDLPFYKAMGLGYSCPCSCHERSDALMIANFQEFLREIHQAGIQARAEETAQRRSQGAKDGWDIRRGKAQEEKKND